MKRVPTDREILERIYARYEPKYKEVSSGQVVRGSTTSALMRSRASRCFRASLVNPSMVLGSSPRCLRGYLPPGGLGGALRGGVCRSFGCRGRVFVAYDASTVLLTRFPGLDVRLAVGLVVGLRDMRLALCTLVDRREL